MPDAETDLLNDALGQIGAGRITAIDDGSVNANYCQTYYPALRKGMLRSHHWNFAIKRANLAQETIPPLFEFAFAYGLPADFLKLVEYNGNNLNTALAIDLTGLTLYALQKQFRIEGWRDQDHLLLSNDGEAKIVYVADMPNPAQWDPLFYQALSSHLASKLASAITKDPRRARELLQMASADLFPLAQAVDGQEGSVQPLVVDDLTWGR